MSLAEKNKAIIKNEAQRLGFDFVGFSKADFLEEDAPRLEQWLNNNSHGEMKYMEKHFDKRLDPRLLINDAKTVISFLINYYPSETQNPDSYKLSKYAYGTDYHLVIRKKLNQLQEFINTEIGAVAGRGFIDSAPILERAWAKKSGLGWIGKKPVEDLYVLSGQLASVYFFVYFLVFIPLLGKLEAKLIHYSTKKATA